MNLELILLVIYIEILSFLFSHRTKSQTVLNSGSSRSHAVYSITLTKAVDGVETPTVFHVVDLAGAERGNRTKASSAQQKEANNINTSLMQLWRCLQGMRRKVIVILNCVVIALLCRRFTKCFI